MGKRLFLLLFAGIMGVVSSSTFLTDADEVVVAGIANTGVETVPLPEPEPAVATAEVYNYTPAAPVAGYAPVATGPRVNYNVTAYVGSMQEFNAISQSLSYSDIYKYGNLIYAHNSPALMGNLSSLYAGEVFTVTEGGVAVEYQVAVKPTEYAVSDLAANRGAKMKSVTTGNGYDLALMTCVGDGSVSRYIVYANKV